MTTPPRLDHLLVEIGAKPAQLLLVAQFAGGDHFVEAGGEGLVIGDRLVQPIAPMRIGPRLVGALLGAGRLAFLDIGLAVGALVLALVLLRFLGAHFHFAAGVGALGLGVVGFVRAFLLALILVTALVRLLVGRLVGRQFEVLEQPARQGREGRLVVDRQRQRVELGAGLFLDPWRDQLEPRPRRLRRLLAGQPLACEQPDGGRQRHLFGGPRAGDRIQPDARFGQVVEVGTDAIHRPCAERLDPRLFQRIEHGARVAVAAGRASSVKLGIVMLEPQRQRVGCPARLGHQPRLQARPRRDHPRHLARRLAAGVGGEHHLGLGILGDRARRAGKHGAEAVERSGNAHLPIKL